MWLITDFLPITQPESTLTVLHISLKSKGQTLRNGFALTEKMISHEIFGHDTCVLYVSETF